MRNLRFVVLGIAILAGVGAVALVQQQLNNANSGNQAQIVPPAPPPPAALKVDVLVADRDLRLGEVLRGADVRWQPWPLEAVSEFYVTKDRDPRARDEIRDALARQGFVAGEPITEAKLLRLDNPTVMAALLRPGMRALAIRVEPETGAGGFILPGDYVDVILTREVEVNDGDEVARTEKVWITDTLLRSVRVLAIDELFENDGSPTSGMNRTATLEVTPDQAEILSISDESGRITLALRGASELIPSDGEPAVEPQPATVYDPRGVGVALDEETGAPLEEETPSVDITVLRYGSKDTQRVQ